MVRTGSAEVAGPAQQFARRILQRWPIVVGLAVVGAVAAAAWSISTATTTWSATSALTTQSVTRAPDQDAVLALGYVDYFNQGSYQEQLRAEIKAPAGVALAAKTGATSPVFYVIATGSAEGPVRTAARDAAAQFRTDVRASVLVERRQSTDDLQKLIDQNVVLVQTPGRTEAEKNVILDQIRALQGRLTDIQGDSTNAVKQLQPEPGVTSTTPSPAADILAGALGAAVLGVLLAILAAALDRRVRSSEDLSQRLGLATVADLTGTRRHAAARARMLANLANTLDLSGADTAKTIALVSARPSARNSEVARSLAAALAQRRVSVRQVDGYRVLAAGAADPAGRAAPGWASPVQPARFADLAAGSGAGDELAVIAAPPLLESAASQSVCAAVDQVIIVVELRRSRFRDLREALALLEAVHAPVLGAIIDGPLTDIPPMPEELIGPVAGGLNGDSGHAGWADELPARPPRPRPYPAGPRSTIDSSRSNGSA